VTRKEARREAQKRWGDGAEIQHHGNHYSVGTRVLGYYDERGYGRSWELALENADRRAAQMKAWEQEEVEA
jgi:hypothetical protein